MTKQRAFNPFYFLLVVTGVVFFVTACAYGVMTVRGLYPEEADGSSAMLAWLNSHGAILMLFELAALAVFTFAAMGTDSFWERMKTSNRSDDEATK